MEWRDTPLLDLEAEYPKTCQHFDCEADVFAYVNFLVGDADSMRAGTSAVCREHLEPMALTYVRQLVNLGSVKSMSILLA